MYHINVYVDKRTYFKIQGNSQAIIKHRILSSNKIQLLQKQQFVNNFVENLRETTEFPYFTSSQKIWETCTPL